MDQQASSSILTPANFDEFNIQVQGSALKATRNALNLPTDISFHRSMDVPFSKDLDAFSARVLSLTNNLLSLVSTGDATKSARAKGKAKLEDQDDIVDNFHSLIVDAMDQLLERTDICLDEFLGRTKPPAIVIKPTIEVQKSRVPRGALDPGLQHASHLQKPQLTFKRRVDNGESPWHPSLSHKYNAQVPLGHIFRNGEEEFATTVSLPLNPYHYEITHISYPQRMFCATTPTPPKSFADTPFTWVSDVRGLHSMLDALRNAAEIAVDLEHHSYRSYSGFLCLMQISTRDADWVIDTLALREDLTELNEIFTDPRIVKVFHGADSDIVWLQQDFNIYVVNLFDTYHASRILEFPRHGLANLLEMYCDFIPDKRYQLADWRIRPLPEEMLEYARSDTHFLLYIYDNLRNALLDRALSRSQSRSQSKSPSTSPPHRASDEPSHLLIKEVLARSEETALRTYEKEKYDTESGTGSNGWDSLARKWNKGSLLAGGPGIGIGALHREVYKSIHRWRDRVAREDDESTRYVLPNHFLFQLAEQPPVDMAALLKAFHSVPPVIRRRAKELFNVIQDSVNRQLSNSLVPVTPEPAIGGPATEIEQEAEPLDPPLAVVPSSLWSLAPNTDTTVTSSSLFGSALSQKPRPSNYPPSSLIASGSSLFGSIIRGGSSTSYHKSRPDNARFKELVTRINSTLIIVPSVPKVVNGDDSNDVGITSESILTMSGMEVELPFVPASQRKASEIVDDSIVVVGQARQKKRKRSKIIPDDDEAVSAEDPIAKKAGFDPTSKPAFTNDQQPFDFSTVPNILDDNPNVEDTKKKKKQKKQKTGGFYGDFPAPPQAHSELKRGNQSHTFK